MCPDSYNLCAADIVLLTENPSFLEASCWSVDVVNGAEDDFLKGFFSTDDTEKFESKLFSKISFAFASLSKAPVNWAFNFLLLASENNAEILKEDLGTKSFISFSLSTSNRSATDWTLPADRPPLTFLQSMGEISNPTNLSIILLACWALTKL